MQDFDFAQISLFAQILPNLHQNVLLVDATASPAPTALLTSLGVKMVTLKQRQAIHVITNLQWSLILSIGLSLLHMDLKLSVEPFTA